MVNPMSLTNLVHPREIYPSVSDLEFPASKRKEMGSETDRPKKIKVRPNPELSRRSIVLANEPRVSFSFTYEIDYNLLTSCLKDGKFVGLNAKFKDLASIYDTPPKKFRSRLYTLRRHFSKDSSAVTVERIERFLEAYHKGIREKSITFSKDKDETIVSLYKDGVNASTIAHVTGKNLNTIRYRIPILLAKQNEQVSLADQKIKILS